MTNDLAQDSPRRPRVRESLIFRPLDEEWVIYDSDGEKLHVLNGSAAMVWLLCDGRLSVPEIVDSVSDAYDNQIPREQLESDVGKTIDEFSKKGLLV